VARGRGAIHDVSAEDGAAAAARGDEPGGRREGIGMAGDECAADETGRKRYKRRYLDQGGLGRSVVEKDAAYLAVLGGEVGRGLACSGGRGDARAFRASLEGRPTGGKRGDREPGEENLRCGANG